MSLIDEAHDIAHINEFKQKLRPSRRYNLKVVPKETTKSDLVPKKMVELT